MSESQSKKKLKNLIIKISEKLNSINLNNCDKRTILEFIYLFNLINSKEFLHQISNNLNNLIDDKNNDQKTELILKLENLISKINAKKYISKTENEYLKSYTYLNKHEIYFLKEIDIDFLVNYIENNLNYQVNQVNNNGIIINVIDDVERDTLNMDKINQIFIELYVKKNSKYHLTVIDTKKAIWDSYSTEMLKTEFRLHLINFFNSIRIKDYEFSTLKLRLNI
uniref:Uncharacterized protein n=1 Tax=Pseudourostyla cristata TaxID=293816 RepID=A0A4P9JLH2_9SPIT|nr:hypothetical protein [Pseudourostyla cristata]